MALADSLLSAIVRADGDALVMHVGERPYVVVGTQTINISTHGLNLEVMTGMLAQLLTAEAHSQLDEFGAVEHKLPEVGADRFSVVAARGGDDIWIEIRRRRPGSIGEAPEVAMTEPPAAAAPVASEVTPPEVLVPSAPEPVVQSTLESAAAESVPAAPAPIPETALEVSAEPMPTAANDVRSEPMVAPVPEPEPVPPAPIAEAPAVMQPVVETPIAESPTELPVVEEVVEVPAPIAVVEAPQPIAEVAQAVVTPVVPEAPMAEAPAPEPQVVEPSLPVSEVARPAETPIAAAAESPVAPASTEVQKVEIPKVSASEPEPPPSPRAIEPEVELPLTRTVRIEVPPRPAAARTTPAVDRLLRVAEARGATALYLLSDSAPSVRVDGDLRRLDGEGQLSRADVESAILEIAPQSAHESIGRGEPTEWIAEFGDLGRMRCATFVDHRGPGAVLRAIATRAATAQQLGLSRDVQALATEPQGLVLVAGPRAGGKSTLLSALVDHVNLQRADYIITLERQIRLLHDHKQGLISQREIRGGPDDVVNATQSALRENPGVLVVDDLISPHMVPLLLAAAADGLLVFVSITAASTADAVAQFIELAPPEARQLVLNSMAESFRGAVAQVLLKKAAGGMVAAREVLLATAPVTRALAEGQLGQLAVAIDGGRKHGMVPFTDTLAEFVRTGAVDVREAFRKAPQRDRLVETLKRGGVDTTLVDRLA